VQVPGHPDEAERMLMRALERDDRIYIRLSDEQNHAPVAGDGLVVLRDGSGAFVLAVGPTLAPTLAATADLDVTVAYLSTVRPFPRAELRAAVRGTDVVLVEPYLAGTSSAEISAALVDTPHRLLALGVPNAEFRRYGDPDEHRAAHGLDAAGIRASIERFDDRNLV
jgi:transketolase